MTSLRLLTQCPFSHLRYGKKAMDDLIETLQNPILSAGHPPTSDVRQALGFRADQLQVCELAAPPRQSLRCDMLRIVNTSNGL